MLDTLQTPLHEGTVLRSIVAVCDSTTLRVNRVCTGPDSTGACPQVAIGEVVPCAGCLLYSSVFGESSSYRVGSQMTLCPVLLAAMVHAEELPEISSV